MISQINIKKRVLRVTDPKVHGWVEKNMYNKKHSIFYPTT